MFKKHTYFFAVIAVLLVFASCKKEYESIETIDDAKIQEYIKRNNLTVTKDPSGFYFQVVNPGTGAPLAFKDSVFYDFDIKGLNGALYQATKPYNNIGSYLGYVTPVPFRTALEGLNRGAEVNLIIPSHLAFGKNGNDNIPSNEIIVSNLKTLLETSQTAVDERRITDFLTAKGITATRHSSGVYYQVLTAGTGADVIDEHSTLVVNYTGRLIDGTVFDSGSAFSTTLGGVIIGWGKVIPMFRSGSKIRLIIPSALAYGTTGYGPVPANCVLDFDIEIVSVTN